MLRIFIVCLFCKIILIECKLPSLHVRGLDRAAIQRKREDTIDMCNLYAKNKHKVFENYDNIYSDGKRAKRNVAKPAETGAAKVERIVDTLYDDMAEKGQTIDYRRRHIVGLNNNNKQNITKGRRFNFAPQILTVDLIKDDHKVPNEDVYKRFWPWTKKWDDAIVPYFIDPMTYDSHLAERLVASFDYIEKSTCIRLQRLREKPDKASMETQKWVYISNPLGIRQCVHSNELKMNVGVQLVVFGYDCMSHGEIIHEVMHVLGFSHEHTRPDRDSYVAILWDNIKPGYKKYFQIRTKDYLMALPYDYTSVMHYPQRAFSRNGKPTITAGSGVKLGQREGLSEIDIQKIDTVYGTECNQRNKQYLEKTCPQVRQGAFHQELPVARKEDIDDYYRDRIWPDGIITYQLKDKMEFSIEERENIKAVMAHIEKETCLEFRHIEGDEEVEEVQLKNTDYAIYTTLASATSEGTASDVPPLKDSKENQVDTGHMDQSVRSGKLKPKPARSGRRHAENVLTLTRTAAPGCKCPKPGRPDGIATLEINDDCFNTVNDLLHVFAHVIGLDHQHNSHDRDLYLAIDWKNLSPDVVEEMNKTLPVAASFNFPYDYQSVTHFPWLQIKHGSRNYILPVWNDGWAMGHWQGLSSTDVAKINTLYHTQCEERKKKVEQAEKAENYPPQEPQGSGSAEKETVTNTTEPNPVL